MKRVFSSVAGDLPKLYGSVHSQPSRACVLLCKENGIVHEFVPVDVFAGDARKPAFRAINPAGLIPVWSEPSMNNTDKPFILTESGAILQYLCEKHSLTSYLPASPREKALVISWIYWNASNTRVGTTGLLMGKYFPRFVSAEESQKALKKYTRSISFLEDHLSKSPHPFLCGSSPTIADLQIICEVDQLDAPAHNIFDFSSYPRVKSWSQSIASSLSSYQEVYDPVIEKARDMAAKK